MVAAGNRRGVRRIQIRGFGVQSHCRAELAGGSSFLGLGHQFRGLCLGCIKLRTLRRGNTLLGLFGGKLCVAGFLLIHPREVLLRGLLKATEKRPIPVAELEKMVEEIETMLQEKAEKEIRAEEIGQFVMERLHELDKVAYVRFASVYRDFKDVIEFKEELEKILKEK